MTSFMLSALLEPRSRMMKTAKCEAMLLPTSTLPQKSALAATVQGKLEEHSHGSGQWKVSTIWIQVNRQMTFCELNGVRAVQGQTVPQRRFCC